MPGLIDATRLFSKQDRAYVSLGAALGLVCLSLMSKLPDLIPAAIKNMKGADFGKAIGEGLGDIGKLTKPAGRAVLQYGSQVQQERYATKEAAGTLNTGDQIINAVGEVGGLTGTVKRKSS